jgi:hypothetical protein
MLSFNNLGNLGRLANQMFQYASLKGISKNRGYDFVIPPKEFFGRTDKNVRQEKYNLYDIFKLEEKNNVGLHQNAILQERMHEFDKELFLNCPDNVDLFGYFQSEKYFKHIENEIREDFTFDKILMYDCKQTSSKFIGDVDSISLHIRRGDYMANPNHPVQPLSYYEQALENLPKDAPVLVFSDDPLWCQDQELFAPDRFFISQGNAADVDMCLMSLCSWHIIANSSFSWWGAWLANSKKVFAPKNWFDAECKTKKIKDMAFGDWSWL